MLTNVRDRYVPQVGKLDLVEPSELKVSARLAGVHSASLPRFQVIVAGFVGM